jgi:hypothetical protein
MQRRPKGAKYSVTMDQIRRSVASSTAIETGESSDAIEARLKASRPTAEGGSDIDANPNQGQPDLDANELALLSSLQKTEDALVRAADIDRLPQELQEIVWDWMRGQTMVLIDDEPWIYSHDWRRFLLWYDVQFHPKS